MKQPLALSLLTVVQFRYRFHAFEGMLLAFFHLGENLAMEISGLDHTCYFALLNIFLTVRSYYPLLTQIFRFLSQITFYEDDVRFKI